MVITIRRRLFGAIDVVEGLVMRTHETGRVLASKVVFVKRAGTAEFEKECDDIGIYKESDLTTMEIGGIKRMMLNHVRQFGKSNLML
jgi:hypothetical protein